MKLVLAVAIGLGWSHAALAGDTTIYRRVSSLELQHAVIEARIEANERRIEDIGRRIDTLERELRRTTCCVSYPVTPVTTTCRRTVWHGDPWNGYRIVYQGPCDGWPLPSWR